MKKNEDNPDTFVMDDQADWEATQVDDVFLPSVNVLICWKDVEAAVSRGAIVPAEAHGLWASWAAPGSPLRRGAGYGEKAFQSTISNQPDELEEMPSFGKKSDGTGIRQIFMLLVGAVVGAALTYFMGR